MTMKQCSDAQQVIPGAVETITLLQRLGKKVLFATNNGRYSRKMVATKLQKMGFKTISGEVITSSFASAFYLKKLGVRGKVYILAEAGTTDELELAGLHVIGGGQDDDCPTDFVIEKIDACIISHDTQVVSAKLSKICTYVNRLKDDKKFIVTNLDMRCPCHDPEIMMPDVGSFTALVHACTGKTPIVMGKPTEWFFRCVEEAVGGTIDPKRVAMFGDQFRTDIAFANKNHFKAGVFVGTGVDTIESVNEQLTQELRPTHYLPKLADLRPFLEEMAGKLTPEDSE